MGGTDRGQCRPRAGRALREFGAPLADLGPMDLSRSGLILQIGIPPNRIDILTAVDGVSFEPAWAGRITTSYGDQRVPVIGREDLVRNKRATAAVLARGTAGVLQQIDPLDPPVYALSIAAVLAVTIGTTWLVSRRASRISPMAALVET